MPDFGQTFERLELKYLISEELAWQIKRAIAGWCASDRFNRPGVGGYPIYSLYLETPLMEFHKAKLRDDPDRFKLRARTYGDGTPVHLEIKRKVLDVIDKARVTVARDRIDDAVRGMGEPLKPTDTSWAILDRFARLAAITGAEPFMLIRYDREAFFSQIDHYARVTFDRRIQAQRVWGWDLAGNPNAWLSLDDAWQMDEIRSPVVLELKCETEIPMWLQNLIRDFSLRCRGFSKYSFGVETAMGRERGVHWQGPY